MGMALMADGQDVPCCDCHAVDVGCGDCARTPCGPACEYLERDG
jgi:hypothetical protein